MSPRPDPRARRRQKVLNAAEAPEQPHKDTADPVPDAEADAEAEAEAEANDAAVTDEVEDGGFHE